MKRKIYVASSWRNTFQPEVVALLREAGHEVYDFRNPAPGDNGFSWKDVDEDWEGWDPAEYRARLQHPRAVDGFDKDMNALEWCDTCVLVQPCGTSSHLELGWAVGAGKATAVLYPVVGFSQPLTRRVEPELMVKMADTIVLSDTELFAWLEELAP